MRLCRLEAGGAFVAQIIFQLNSEFFINNDKLAEVGNSPILSNLSQLTSLWWLWRVTQAQAYQCILAHSHGLCPRGFESHTCQHLLFALLEALSF
jgi:hypothetical protein